MQMTARADCALSRGSQSLILQCISRLHLPAATSAKTRSGAGSLASLREEIQAPPSRVANVIAVPHGREKKIRRTKRRRAELFSRVPSRGFGNLTMAPVVGALRKRGVREGPRSSHEEACLWESKARIRRPAAVL